jgi:folate-binding protein YgfZ
MNPPQPISTAALSDELKAARTEAAWFLEPDLAVMAVRGKDRLDWLNRMATNDLADKKPGQGCYAFVTNVQGRIVSDLFILVGDSEITVVLPKQRLEAARAYLDKYIIMEDVELHPSPNAEVMRLSGPNSAEIAAAIGFNAGAEQEAMDHVTAALTAGVRLVRDNFAGLESFILVVDGGESESLRSQLGENGCAPCSLEALETLRIGAGRPSFGVDFDESSLPAETSQEERAVSYAKGCYIGQEVVARMHSHGGPARRLVGLRIEDVPSLSLPADVLADERTVGLLTSAVHLDAAGGVIGLATVKRDHAEIGHQLQIGGATESARATVSALPFEADPTSP